jgi:hypothetical protein
MPDRRMGWNDRRGFAVAQGHYLAAPGRGAARLSLRTLCAPHWQGLPRTEKGTRALEGTEAELNKNLSKGYFEKEKVSVCIK